MRMTVGKSLISIVVVICLLVSALPLYGVSATDGVPIFTAMTHEAGTVAMDGTTVKLTLPSTYAGNTVDISKMKPSLDLSVLDSISETDIAYAPAKDVAINSSAKMSVSYKMKDDTAGAVYKTEYTVNVERTLAPFVDAEFTGTIYKERITTDTTSLRFSLSDFSVNYKPHDDTRALTGIVITGGASSVGHFQYNGTDYNLTSELRIPIGDLSKLLYIPAANGTANYQVYALNENDIPSAKRIGPCTLSIFVAGTSTSLGEISYRMSWNSHRYMDAEDFNRVYRSHTGSELEYVEFSSPSSSYGYLYYNYSSSGSYDFQVRSSDRMYMNSSSSSSSYRLSNVAFVPRLDYEGTAYIYYRAYGSSTGSVEGTVRIDVEYDGYYSNNNNANNSYTASNTVTYPTGVNEAIFLSDADFNAALVTSAGYALSYIRFNTMPPTNTGRLQYNYNGDPASTGYGTVSTSTRYYRSSTPAISNVSFVPYSNYSGSVSIPYTAYTSNGAAFGGTMYVRVGLPSQNSSSSMGDVALTAQKGAALDLEASDFQAAVAKVTTSTLSYITFTGLPTDGAMYFNYRSADDFDAAVSTSIRYYRASTPGISQITYVPEAGQSGKVSIPYTAYTLNGRSYSGNLVISVASAGTLRALSYSVPDGEAVDFEALGIADDIRALVRSRAGASASAALSHAVFDIPDPDDGTLYSSYSSALSGRREADDGERFYYEDETPLIGELTFVPDYDAAGEFTLTYTAYTGSGRAYEGDINIAAILLPDGWSREEVASLAGRGVVPDALMEDYAYHITRAEYTALLVNTYTYADAPAEPPDSREAVFADLRGNPYARQARQAYELGLVDGDGSSSYFNPDVTLTREQAAKILCATVAKITGADIATDYALSYADTAVISGWAVPYVAYATENGLMLGGDGNNFLPLNALSREEAMALVERAIVKYGL